MQDHHTVTHPTPEAPRVGRFELGIDSFVETSFDPAKRAKLSEAQRIKDLEAEVRELRRANEILKTASVNSTRQRNNASSLSAGVSKSRVFRGPEFNRAATASRSAWVRSFMLTPLGKY